MHLFGLLDCNNFYVSCERAFKPSLEGKPVLVLSNNDGCVISRSSEVKQLGIKMGAPYFQIKKFCEGYDVKVFSSNYALYADMSSRVMRIVQAFEPCTEVYSIDEIFIALEANQMDKLERHTEEMRQTILRGTGIPVSIGFSHTKTLSKVANHIAKKQRSSGVCILTGKEDQDAVLASFPVGDVWGVGRRLEKKLAAMNIHTALALRSASKTTLRERFSVMMAKTIDELRGTPCNDLAVSEPKKSIVCSRSFGEPITELALLQEAISQFSTRACEKLRAQSSKVSCLHVYCQRNTKVAAESKVVTLTQPVDDTRVIIAAAKSAIAGMYQQGVAYRKAGVMLSGIVDEGFVQEDLFSGTSPSDPALMEAIDQVNRRFGKGRVYFGAEGKRGQRRWHKRAHYCSSSPTTSWHSLLRAE